MGLDMYAYSTRETIAATDFDHPDDATQIAYWRKHPDLHGFMESLYRQKGGTATFNCTPVALTAVDLDALEQAVRARQLPPTSGFFFGQSNCDESEAEDLAFIGTARERLAAGFNIYYTSWW